MHPDVACKYLIWWVGLAVALLGVFLEVLVEVTVRATLPVEARRRHDDVAAAMLSIIGVTYAVLHAFVAMLAWESFNQAKAANHAEAGLVRDVANVVTGLPQQERSAMQDEIAGYVRAVIMVE